MPEIIRKPLLQCPLFICVHAGFLSLVKSVVKDGHVTDEEEIIFNQDGISDLFDAGMKLLELIDSCNDDEERPHFEETLRTFPESFVFANFENEGTFDIHIGRERNSRDGIHMSLSLIHI